MRIRWLGHASFLIEVGRKRIYVDPYAGEYREKADVILVTHGHRDHCDPEKIRAVLQPGTVTLASRACSGGLPGWVMGLDPGEMREVGGITVRAVESYNYKRFRSPGVPFHPKGIQVGFIIEAEGKRVYHAGDTDFLPSMRELGRVDVALLPIDGRFTKDVEEAAEAALAVHPRIVIPMHRRDASAEEFKRRMGARSDIAVAILTEEKELKL